ncbi:hypothetical protein SY85_03190 [Flavisolibacter tropicus]|uniref:Uncharacterized protein n=1 Tax=Flavisolibacter tropicus TaxID=1492898 RepID=A0A172TS00_9BACT|nr:hypothetical protein SY85_03190 [Flavisolibacter tropicus]
MQKERSSKATVRIYVTTIVTILLWNIIFSFTPLLMISLIAQPVRLFVPMLQGSVIDTITTWPMVNKQVDTKK